MFDIQVTEKTTGKALLANDIGGDGFGILDSGELILYKFPTDCERLDMNKYDANVFMSASVKNRLDEDFNNVRAIK